MAAKKKRNLGSKHCRVFSDHSIFLSASKSLARIQYRSAAMEIRNTHEFLDYWEKVRQRTLKVVACIPPDKFDWSYREGKFSFADIIRHLATIERYMYAENVQRKPSCYPGHGRELADGPENVLAFFAGKHQESMDIFSRLTESDLNQKCLTPAGTPITVWKWLRAMVEHEVH